jgi:hypothetical protein
MDADSGRLRRERAHFGDEGGGRGDREMGAHRLDALPLLDEHQPVGVFDIDMAVVRQTPRLAPRPRAMPGAERNHALAMLGGEDDVAGDENHYCTLGNLRGYMLQFDLASLPRSPTEKPEK